MHEFPLKKSEQLPTDQEQFMLVEDLYKTVEKLEKTQEQNMTNKKTVWRKFKSLCFWRRSS